MRWFLLVSQWFLTMFGNCCLGFSSMLSRHANIKDWGSALVYLKLLTKYIPPIHSPFASMTITKSASMVQAISEKSLEVKPRIEEISEVKYIFSIYIYTFFLQFPSPISFLLVFWFFGLPLSTPQNLPNNNPKPNFPYLRGAGERIM